MKVPNGLDVGFLKLSDGMSSSTKTLMKPGWFRNQNNERVTQSMQNENGIQKGIRTILQERGKHKDERGQLLPLQCKYCRGNTTVEERQEGLASGLIKEACCASYVLANEPDFLEQEEWLTEVVRGAGFEIIFYPKYHCELNFIEMLWGWIKSYHRRTCTYVYKDLKDALPTTLLETMPLAFVRRASRYCFRFMSGYREGLQGPLLDFSMKKYSSHRSIPAGVIDILQADFNQHLKKKSNNNSSSK